MLNSQKHNYRIEIIDLIENNINHDLDQEITHIKGGLNFPSIFLTLYTGGEDGQVIQIGIGQQQ